jgi:hypothetical protein
VEAETSGGGVIAKLEEQWRKTKGHAETYPYVWGSYILVYGGLGAYLTWRWRKLRRTEDRLRVIQERLRKLAAAEESQAASASGSTTAPTPPSPQQPAAGPANPASGVWIVTEQAFHFSNFVKCKIQSTERFLLF